MKKNLKKLSSLALAFLLVSSLSVPAFAADVSAQQAKSAALKDAGYAQSKVLGLYAELDRDDGVKHYDVSFYVKQSDGSFLEYDYEVRASDGKILQKEVEREGSKPSAQKPAAQKPAADKPAVSNSKDVGESKAKQAALAHFGLKAEDVKFFEARKDNDDGVKVYEFEFCKPYSVKYSCEVVASSGKVRDAEKESVRGIGDKIELFLDVLFWNLFNK